MLRVMEMHWEKVEEIKRLPEVSARRPPASSGTRCSPHGRRYGFRNAQATVLAPTGTISFMMDCDTTGIEPDIALVKYKQLAGGGMLKIVNQTVPLALRTLGYDDAADRGDHRLHRQARHDRRRAGLEARASAGVRLCVPAAQRQAVDPLAGARPDDGRRAAVHLGRDLQDGQHAQGQHAGRHRRRLHGRLAAGPEGPGDLPRRLEGESSRCRPRPSRTRRPKSCVAAPRRERLPDTRQSITHKFSVAGHEGYITVGLYPDGRPGELFITMAKEGSTIGGLMDCFGTAVSMSLQYGVPLEVLRQQVLAHAVRADGLHEEPRHPHRQEHRRLHLPLAGHHVPARLPRGEQDASPTLADAERRSAAANGDSESEAEPRPAATKAGGPNAGQGSAKPAVAATARPTATAPGTAAANGNGTHASAASYGAAAATAVARPTGAAADRPGSPRASSSPASRPTPPVATTAAPSPSATATATSATTAATAWAARRSRPEREIARHGARTPFFRLAVAKKGAGTAQSAACTRGFRS